MLLKLLSVFGRKSEMRRQDSSFSPCSPCTTEVPARPLCFQWPNSAIGHSGNELARLKIGVLARQTLKASRFSSLCSVNKSRDTTATGGPEIAAPLTLSLKVMVGVGEVCYLSRVSFPVVLVHSA